MQTAELPYEDLRLRDDLQISPGEEGTWIVTHSDGKRVFRFSDQEYLLATLLHAHPSFDPLAAEFVRRTGKRLSRETLERFIETLKGFELFEGFSAPEPWWKSVERYSRILVPFHQPDRILERMIPFAQGLFSRQFCCIAILMLGISWSVGGMQWGMLQAALKGAGLPPVARLVLAWLAFGAIGLVHEYGHGLACKVYGGKVPRMGFMLYYLIPAWFCDATSAYAFSRWKRVAVDLAGLYTTSLLGGVALFLLQWPLPGGGRFFLAQLVFLALFASLANLIPFVKLDGYYLLSDLLGIENLRPRALRTLLTFLRKPFLPNGLADWLFLSFGILGSLTSLAMLGLGLKMALTLVQSLFL